MPLNTVFDDIDERMVVIFFDKLQALCFDLAEAKGFHSPRSIEGVYRDSSAGERLALIGSEVFEALERYREDKNPSGLYFEVDGKPEGVASEIADVVIRCLDYAGVYEIPLAEVILSKLHYNAGRPQMHGGKII